MPELPEVETVVRDIRPLLIGKRIEAVQTSELSLRRPWLPAWSQSLPGNRVQSVRRRGKWIVVDLDKGGRLLFHLGMTGQIRIVPAEKELDNHTHLIFSLAKGKEQFRFCDIRRFGSASMFVDESELETFFVDSGLGPEPLGLNADYLYERIAKTSRCLKAVLLDQQVVAGVGNIYADESLFAAKLSPQQLGEDTTKPQSGRLSKCIEEVLTRAIEFRGSTISNYVGGSGLKGGFQNEFTVYGRTGKPCVRCKSKIKRMRLAGRSTHYCPKCQKQT